MSRSTDGMRLWPKFSRDAPGPGVGFHRNGTISLNPEAASALKLPKYVQILVDLDRRLIAVQPCHEDDHEARSVVYTRMQLGRGQVQASTLGRSLGFTSKQPTFRLPAIVDDGVLWIEIPREV